MTRVKIAELKDRLSEHLRRVERGEEIEVTDRGRPIARIIPIPAGPPIRIIPAKRPRSSLPKKYPPANWPISSLEMLLEDRRKR